MKLRGVFAVFAIVSASAFAYGPEPERPVFNESTINPLFKRAAYAAFLGDACSVNHSIPDQIRKIAKIVYSDSQNQQEQISFFSSRKSNFSSDASAVGIFKRCNLEAGKTRSFVNDVGRELDDVSQNYLSQLSSYETAHYQWWQNVAREREEAAQRERENIAAEQAAHNEKIRSSALSLSEQLGKLVVSNAYQGGQSIGVKLVSYEYIESTSTMRMKVELGWNGSLSGESGYAADGEIIATYDDSPKWTYGRNYKWNPTYQSSKLDEWISQRQFIRAIGALSGN